MWLKWASVVCVVLQRPCRLVSSLQAGWNCFLFSKPQGGRSRLQAGTFPRSSVDLRRCKSINVSIPPESEPKVYSASSVVLRSRGFVVSSGFKRQSDAVDAESLACWLRSVVKHMTQMGVTLANKRRTDGMSVQKHKVALQPPESSQCHWHFYKEPRSLHCPDCCRGDEWWRCGFHPAPMSHEPL